jgi:hypothetical protein
MSRVPRAGHIGSKATTPSVESRERSSLRGGAVSRARKEAVETPAQRWAAAVDGVLARLRVTLAEHEDNE